MQLLWQKQHVSIQALNFGPNLNYVSRIICIWMNEWMNEGMKEWMNDIFDLKSAHGTVTKEKNNKLN